MSLFSIQNSVQEVAEAIEAVLGVDVTIIDSEMNRVAATGRYRDSIGRRLPSSCSFEVVADTRLPQIIEKPNISQECIGCSQKGNCAEMATLGYPILNSGELEGVIGLIAFDEEQKEKIQEKKSKLIVFLSKLSDLISGNINYNRTIRKISIQNEETRMIIDRLDKGIIVTDEFGKIKFVNRNTKEYLKLDEEAMIGEKIKSIIPDFNINEEDTFRIEKKISIEDEKKSFIIKHIPVLVDNKKTSSIIEIQKTFDLVKDAYKLIEGERQILFQDILGDSTKIREVKNIARGVADSTSTVFLRGESGTGKELFARAIHFESDRKKAPFIAINCASIPDNLLESELFGYEGGSFTGAKKEGRMGKFELANKGTLFLDEIGDLPLHIQPKLLRALQEKSFMRLGGKEKISTNFRLLTATNRNIEEMVENGEFREDLYYRLNVIPINIPPLRERADDIELLSEYLLEKNCIKLGKDRKEFSNDLKLIISRYSWPGNIREMENTIEYLVNVVSDRVIKAEDLPENIAKNLLERQREEDSFKASLSEKMDSYEKRILEKYLLEFGSTTDDKKIISEKLSINLSTLYRKLSKYNLQK